MLAAGAYFVLACAALFGALSTWLARGIALALGVVNHPNPIIPQHTRPVAYLGGAGVLVGAAAALAAAAAAGRLGAPGFPAGPVAAWRIALPAALFLALGVADDLLKLSAAVKLSFQFVLAGLGVALGLICPLTGFWPVDAALSGMWILLLVNAFNVIDVCDGLLAGVSAIIFLFLAHLMAEHSLLAMAAAGACVGFLAFNRPPASIFLGDAGSHLLGFLAAALTLTWGKTAQTWPLLPQAVLITAVPLFEVVFLVLTRTRKGLPWWKGSSDHFSLRLQAAGLTKLQTDLLTWTAAALLCGAAATMDLTTPFVQIPVLLTALVALAACGRLLLVWEVSTPCPQGQPRS